MGLGNFLNPTKNKRAATLSDFTSIDQKIMAFNKINPMQWENNPAARAGWKAKYDQSIAPRPVYSAAYENAAMDNYINTWFKQGRHRKTGATEAELIPYLTKKSPWKGLAAPDAISRRVYDLRKPYER
jgi:hypothetical protein